MFNYQPGAYTITGFHDVNGQPVEDFAPVHIADDKIQGYLRAELTRIGARGVYVNRPAHARDNGSRVEYEFTIDNDRHFVAFDIARYGGTYPVELQK